MKYISFAVPCYNSQEYMRKCVESLLKGGQDVEIIIVNDGSKDDTLAIANEYAAAYPDTVRVVDKENGGHGSGVNAGLKLAKGLYYKVVDSDDWVDEGALAKLLETIKNHEEKGSLPDLYVVNYVYEHGEDGTFACRYAQNFPTEEFCGWNDTKRFKLDNMMLMHSLVYKTEVLRRSGLVLPEHTFYVDDIFSYSPLPYVKTIFYLNIDFYRYFIGRADQSVNFDNFTKRYDQMIRVMQTMTDRWTYEEIKSQTGGLRRYMFHALENYMLTTQLFIGAMDTPERRAAFSAMWKHIKETDKKLYYKLRYRTTVLVPTVIPWKLRGRIMVKIYHKFRRKKKLG